MASMSFISIFRVVVLSLSLLFSVVVLGLGAHWTQGTSGLLEVVFDFEIAALLAACLSLLSLPVFLFVAATRKGAFPSRIIVELPSLAVLIVLWFVSSILTARRNSSFYPFGCTVDSSWCNEFFAIEGLSFLIWIMLSMYTATLLTYTLIAQNRGINVWHKGVSEVVFFDNTNGKADLFAGEVEVRPMASNQHYQPNQSEMTPAPTPGINPYTVPSTPGTQGGPNHSGYPQV